MEYLIKPFISVLFKILGNLMSLGKKQLEGEYVTFRLLKSYTLTSPSIVDNFDSVYLHSVYEFEKQKNPELTKLFYLSNAKEAFNAFYNEKDNSAFKIKLEEILHTNSKVLSLKNLTINIEDEIFDFVKIFELQTKRATSQSNKNLLGTSDSMKQIALTMGNIEKQQIENKKPHEEITDSKVFIQGKIASPIDTIPRKVIHFKEFKNKINNPFFNNERIDLKEAIIKHKKIVLLANGGVGKSTELEKVTWSFENSELIPIFISLRTYTNQKIDELLPANWKNVRQEKLLLIIDGLDEVKSADFLTAIKNILFYIEHNLEVNILISCRTNFFDLPVADSKDSLDNKFVPFFLDEVSLYSLETREFIKRKFNIDPINFINEIEEKKYMDLATNPFYLIQMLQVYSGSGKLDNNRGSLFEQFVTSNIKFDENKFKLTVQELKHKKGSILKLLERIALGMEILGKNIINSDELFCLINQNTEFDLLIHTLLFKKQEGEDENWQFDHRLIQEYLAARALSLQSEETIIKFIAFEPEFKKIIPSWLNTLTFLISILNKEDSKLNSLIDWIIKNEKEVLVKIEREKIGENIRNIIFQGIFNYYKNYDVWISSNKFSYKELAFFGQSAENITFLLKELQENNDKPTTLINAISIIGYFEYVKPEVQVSVKTVLLKLIEDNINSSEIVSTSIRALTKGQIYDTYLIQKLILLLENEKNQEVRSAMYSLLIKSDSVTQHLDYVLEGYSIMISKEVENNSYGSNYQLFECIKNEKSALGIKKILDFIQNYERFDYSNDSEEILRSILKNAEIAYLEDTTIYEAVFKLMVHNIKKLYNEKVDKFITFFDKTNTRQRSFNDAWLIENDSTGDRLLIVSKLFAPSFFDFVIEEYKNKRFEKENLTRLIFEMNWIGNPIKILFEEEVKTKTGFKVEYLPYIDREPIRKKKQKDSFSLLFDPLKFEKETLKVFNEEQKDEFTNDEIWEVKKSNNKCEEWEDKYSDTSMRLLRDFGLRIKKTEVESWFKKQKQVEFYSVSMIFEYLYNNRIQEVTKEQEEWIVKWCNKTTIEVNFKTNVNISAWISLFMKRFKIKFPSSALLDMLSFEYFEGEKWIGFENLIEQLDHNDASNRILENLKSGILNDNVLKNHVTYVSERKIMQAYPSVLNEIGNINRDEHNRSVILDIYFKGTNDIIGMKEILPTIDSKLRWDIVKKLFDSGQNTYLIDFLSKILHDNTDESIKAAEYLVKLENIDGVKYFVNWILQNKGKLKSHRFDCLSSLKKIEWIPYLVQLLEFSFQNKITLRGFDTLNSVVINTFHEIAMATQEEFNEVTGTLKKFMDENIEKYENINYLIHTIERIETQFYMNKSKTYSINQAVEKLSLIQN